MVAFGYTVGYEVAYDNGYETGYDEGILVGYAEGNMTGFHTGYASGYRTGNETGYELGYKSGYDIGYKIGYETGYEDGNETSFKIGYETGYEDGYEEGNETGYENGYLQGTIDGAGRGYTVRDPIYKEVLAFIRQDKTDENKYNAENYTCLNFVADLKNNAFKAGYRCGLVFIEFPESAHTIVCFNTTDRGIVFVEPQTDEIVILTVGQPYWDRTKYIPTYNDTIVRFVIIW